MSAFDTTPEQMAAYRKVAASMVRRLITPEEMRADERRVVAAEAAMQRRPTR